MTLPQADYYDPANHEVASNFVDFFRPIRFNWRSNGVCLAREADEEARICNSVDLIACMGANEIVTEGRRRACRQLCAYWPYGRWQTGLFDEVRQFAGPATPAAAGGNQGSAGSGAGSAKKRDFRLVL